jgi:hypothetical protein
MVCNPTGIKIGKWRAPSETRAPHPSNLPETERKTWDIRTACEVTLARAVKEMNEKCVRKTQDEEEKEFEKKLWHAWWTRKAEWENDPDKSDGNKFGEWLDDHLKDER